MTLDERLLAYVDGELAGEELAKFEAEIAADPRLAAEVDKHRGLAARMAADRAARAEVAQGKSKMGQGRSKAGRAPAPARARLSLLHWAGIVLGLLAGTAAGIAAGRYAWPEQGPLVAVDGTLTAAGGLKGALDSQLTDEKGPVTVGATFRTAKGRYCRTFRSRPDSLAGLACRQSDGWVMQTTTVLGAADAMPPAVLTAMDGLISGVPLDEAAERAARDKNWK